MKSTTTFFLTLFAMITAFGQQRSLDECIRIALANNEQIKNSMLDVQASDYQVKEAKGALLPKIDVNGQYMYYLDVPSQYAPASAFGGPEGEFSKLTMTLPQTTSVNLQSTQILFNQSVFTGLKAAHVVREASSVKLSLTREDIIYNVAATYYTVQILQDNLLRLHENIDNLEKTVKINETLKDNELVSVNVHNRLLINLENLKNQYENQRLSQDKNITLLKYLMSANMNESLSVQPFNYAEVLNQPVMPDISQRPDIRLQEAQIKLAQFEKKNAVAAYYPTLVAVSTVGASSYYDEFAPAKQINNDWLGNRSIALTLKVPVFDGFQRKHKVKQKQLAVDQNINTLAMMKSNAEKEVADAIEKYVSNASQVTSNKRSLDLAEQLFATSQSEFENGLTSSTELLNAQNDLSSARTNYSTALLNLKLAELGWKKASGTLLPDYTIEN
jgi:outer membrane protein